MAQWLRDQKHEVSSVYEEARGMNDDDIIQKAFAEGWILITNDKDFGEKVYRERRPHRGVIFMRLDDERAANKKDVLRDLELRAGWGHRGKANVAMPGKGRTRTRDYTAQEREASAQTPLGDVTHDIFLNDIACWSNVPARV